MADQKKQPALDAPEAPKLSLRDALALYCATPTQDQSFDEVAKLRGLATWQSAAVLGRYKALGLTAESRVPPDVLDAAIAEALHGSL